MNEKFLILERDIQTDLVRVEKLYEALDHPDLSEGVPAKETVFVAYQIHGIYTAFENIFRNIARAFENQLDAAKWHRQLLKRMHLDLTPLRPAVIGDEMYENLRELLSFRHFFRTAYGVDLDPVRLRGVLGCALELKALYPRQIGRFLEFLRAME